MSLKKDKFVVPITPVEPITDEIDEVELDNIFGGIAYDEIQDEQEPSVVEEVESKNFDWDEIGNWDDLDAKDNEDEIVEENGYFHKPNASDLMDTPSSTKGKFDAGTTTKPPESGFFSGVSKVADVPPVVFELDKDISPDFQAAVSTPQPIDAGPSILDSSVPELQSMDIGVLRSVGASKKDSSFRICNT